MTLKAPFPYMGGKSRVTREVWRRFGDVPNYVEPFFGSGAVLLGRPPFEGNRIETVNDLDGHVSNFWRALQAAPDEVAAYADWPVSECVPAGTMIATPTGPVSVESIKVGMTVLGERNGVVVSTTVMATQQSWADDFYQVGDLRLTGNHPIWTKGDGYQPASRLTPGAIVARLDWPTCELDFVMVQSSYDKEDLDYLRSDRPTNRRSALRRGIRASQSKVQRASIKRRQGGQDASGLLDSVSDLSRDSAGVSGSGNGSRRHLARKRNPLDRVLSGTRALDEYHQWGRGVARLHPDAGASPEVVADEERRQVCTWAYSGNARKKAYRRNATENIRGGTEALQRRNTAKNIEGGKGTRHEQAERTVCGEAPGNTFDGRTSGENHRQNYGAQAGSLHRNRASIRVDNGCGPALSGQRGVYQSGDPQGLPLQRASFSPCVAVYNFQTQTGNYFADNILVHNCDLHARGDWLYYRPDAREWVERLRSDPDYYDAKSAGWWVWFVSCWIGGLPAVPQTTDGGKNVYGQGGGADGVYERLPHLGNTGMGVARQRPHLGSGGQGNGVHGSVHRKMPHLGNAGKGVRRKIPELRSGTSGIRSQRASGPTPGSRRAHLTAYLRQLAARLERVRVTCGDWIRVTGPSVTWKHGVTAVFLDPPYSGDERSGQLYSTDSHTVAVDVREWAIANGDNPQLRIAICGYDTEHGGHMPDGWHAHAWKAAGGYGSQGNGRGRANAAREVVWFSPHCLNPIDTMPLFAHANGKAVR